MHESISKSADFRGLFEVIEYYKGGSLYRDTLVPWLQGEGEFAKRQLQDIARRTGTSIPDAPPEDLFFLYALSRINDTLLLGFQPDGVGGWGCGPEILLDEYLAFMTALGLHVVRETGFSPFFHEIVTVEQDENAGAPVVVTVEYWPTLMLGEMMFSRAGVAVTGGREHIRKEIAETSTMYWAFRRKNRPRNDLSLGWGSNSQWRTPFRRDYRIGGRLYFNVDGGNDLSRALPGVDRDGLAPHERLELLLHRCFITAAAPHDDCFPYEDTYQITTLEQRD